MVKSALQTDIIRSFDPNGVVVEVEEFSSSADALRRIELVHAVQEVGRTCDVLSGSVRGVPLLRVVRYIECRGVSLCAAVSGCSW